MQITPTLIMKKFWLIFLALATVVSACNKPTPDTPGGDDPDVPVDPPQPPAETGLPDISTFKLGKTFAVPFGGRLLMPYKGFSKGDVISLTARYDASVRFELKCEEVTDEDGAYFTTPARYAGGMCEVSCTRFTGGMTYVDMVDAAQIDKVPGKTTYGRVIDIDGNPVKDVVVSDGVLVTTTDDSGRYYLASKRKYGYVFISVPSGYKVAVNRTIPQFFRNFTSTSYTDYEVNSFILTPENNTRHNMTVFTDTHLAARTNDLRQFESSFKTDLRKQAEECKAAGVPMYCLTLGDLAWDEYWYNNSYSLENYAQTMADLDIPIYNIVGNHDNDPYVADDFGAEAAFRKWIGPTYYSFNIGDIHYILMDNTLFSNKGGAPGIIGNVQDYKEGFTADQLKWLKSDLSHVPAGTTVFFGTHIAYTGRPSQQTDGSFKYGFSMPADYRTQLSSLFAQYKVHYVSGHNHISYTNRLSDRLMEHNIVGVCGTWWWTGYYSNYKCNLCRDGAPMGSKVFEIDGSDVKWQLRSMDHGPSYQFRVYDLNNCQITRAVYCPSGTRITDEFFEKYTHGYSASRSDNKLLVNVFDYDDNWTVTASESGSALSVKRVDSYDPLHITHFNTRRLNGNATESSMTFPTLKTSHLFEVSAHTATTPVTITVTDSFGRQFVETVQRPRKLYDMYISSNY